VSTILSWLLSALRLGDLSRRVYSRGFFSDIRLSVVKKCRSRAVNFDGRGVLFDVVLVGSMMVVGMGIGKFVDGS
jgi:hypothetical protein